MLFETLASNESLDAWALDVLNKRKLMVHIGITVLLEEFSIADPSVYYDRLSSRFGVHIEAAERTNLMIRSSRAKRDKVIGRLLTQDDTALLLEELVAMCQTDGNTLARMAAKLGCARSDYLRIRKRRRV